ncbi:LAMI_0F07096g1_1 [Lachancea mirantina]|uniref:LAMI_0F07096g1_1 n=1 Tax=Lachancea mirantina TaxID=1230905 RepID=A0A1G4JZQ4_9SACH|nr:LAMI_0F07096g1_1 [Lachancea mirantina]
MSRSGRLRSRTVNLDRTTSSRNKSESEEADVYGLVEETSGRPFRMIEGLPCSTEIPQYGSALTHALSVKDSAVLYSSLLASRRTWINAEMFDMFWSKQYLNTKERERLLKEGIDPDSIDASAAREKMYKLCDCEMVGGPHAFPVRLFILKNEEMEKRWNDAIESKRRAKEERKRQELDQKARKQKERKQNQAMKKQLQDQPKVTSTSGERKPTVKRKPRKESNQQQQQQAIHKRRPRSQSPPQSKPPMQSAEDQKMITNLNIMAQKDPKLNSLMVIVAGGSATAQQVEEFKKNIETARKMPPPPGWQPVVQTLRAFQNAGANERKALSKNQLQTSEKSVSEVCDQVKAEAQPSVDTTAFSAEQPRQKRKYTKRKHAQEVEPEDKSMQLTTFQQKYMGNADLAFEYVESPNKRYSLPKDAIFEQLEDETSYLMSWILVHNRKEIDKFREKKIALREKEERKKKPDEKPDANSESEENGAKQTDDMTLDIYDDPKCPVPLYSPLTLKFSNIHKKFAPIIINSVNSVDRVQKLMTKIMKNGTRLSGYNLWFQLDAYDDNELSESLRYELKEYEQGFKSKRQRKQI